MIKISVTIIAKNSQKYLKKVLASTAWADEIIIIDDHSSDATLAIAKEFGAKIFQHSWEGFARQKNFGIKKAKNNWILSLDSDEVVSKELIEEIKHADFIKHDGYYLSRRNIYSSKWIRGSGFYPDWQLRLFRRDMMQFIDLPIHEQVKPVGKVGYLQNDIIHFTYVNDKEYADKIKKYAILDGEVLFSKGRKWSIWYQYGKPFKEFFERLLVKKGYIDGLRGIKIAYFSGSSRWLAAKELRRLSNENRH